MNQSVGYLSTQKMNKISFLIDVIFITTFNNMTERITKGHPLTNYINCLHALPFHQRPPGWENPKKPSTTLFNFFVKKGTGIFIVWKKGT